MRRMVLGLVLAASPGCDLVYGLTGRTEAVLDAPIDQPIDAAELACPKDPARLDDEDDDDFPNSCDNCPHIKQMDQADGDTDGVGDACDPRPTMPDKIDYFDGFDSLPNGLDLVPPNLWKVENGQLVATSVPALFDAMARVRHATGDAQIITRLTLMSSNGDPESAGVWSRIGPHATEMPPTSTATYPPGVVLEVLRNNAGATRGCHIWETWQAQPAQLAVDCAQNQALFQTARPYTMSLDCTEGPAPECRGVIAYDTPQGHTEIPMDWPNATRATGPAGLRAYSVDVAFDYIVIIRHE